MFTSRVIPAFMSHGHHLWLDGISPVILFTAFSGWLWEYQSHDVIITSLLHQNDVTTSFWYNNDVIITPCVRWVVKGNIMKYTVLYWTIFALILQCMIGARFEQYVDGLAQDCSNSIALAMELLQSCTKPSLWSRIRKHSTCPGTLSCDWGTAYLGKCAHGLSFVAFCYGLLPVVSFVSVIIT